MAGPEPGDERETEDEWFRSAYPALRRFAAVVAPLDLDPDDLLQEAVARTLSAGPLARLDHPIAYLRRAMTNVVANHNRSRGRERRARLRLRTESAENTIPRFPSDLADLDHLDPTDRVAVFLADVEGIPLAEVAETLGINGPAARARVSRARRRLRAALAADPSTDPSGKGAPS